MQLDPHLPVQNVIGFPITALPFNTQIELMVKWASRRMSKVVYVADAHQLREAYSNPSYASVLLDADVITPGEMPLVWLMRILGNYRQERVASLDIFMALCEKASINGISIYCLGSKPEILGLIREQLNKQFPKLKIAGMEPLPFRPLTLEEDEAIIQRINESGAGIVFVSLGCPKQELWTSQHKDKIQAVMIGVGRVFPIFVGTHKSALEPLGTRYFSIGSGGLINEDRSKEQIEKDGWMPKDWLSDLNEVRQRLIESRTPKWQIKIAMAKTRAQMISAAIQIRFDNL